MLDLDFRHEQQEEPVRLNNLDGQLQRRAVAAAAPKNVCNSEGSGNAPCA